MAFLTEDQSELDAIRRKRGVADALLKHSMAIPNAGIWGALAPIAVSYFNTKNSQDWDAREKEIGKQAQERVTKAILGFQEATTPRPAKTEEFNDPGADFAGKVEGLQTVTPAYNPTARDKQSAALTMAGQLGGDVQQAIAAQLIGGAFKGKDFDPAHMKEIVGPDGKRVYAYFGTDGTVTPTQAMVPEKLHFADTGGGITAVGEYSGTPLGSLGKTQTPDSIAGNAVTMRGQNMTDTRQREQNAIAQQGMQLTQQKQLADLAEMNNAKQGKVSIFDNALSTLAELKSHPGLSGAVGMSSIVPAIPGSEKANFQAALETFQAQTFLPQVEALRGMGALSDAEGKKITAAVGALNPRMGEKAFRDSLGKIEQQLGAARTRAANSAAQIGAITGAAGTQSKPVVTGMSNPEDVRAAYQSGAISKEEAKAILRDMKTGATGNF